MRPRAVQLSSATTLTMRQVRDGDDVRCNNDYNDRRQPRIRVTQRTLSIHRNRL